MQLQRIQGRRKGALCVWKTIKLQAGWIQEPFLIGQLIRPHDVKEGRAKRLQSLPRICNLTELKDTLYEDEMIEFPSLALSLQNEL